MTVVTTPTSAWPTVQPERTTLLYPTCGPKQTDGSRVLFEFSLDSCGTRAMVQLKNSETNFAKKAWKTQSSSEEKRTYQEHRTTELELKQFAVLKQKHQRFTGSGLKSKYLLVFTVFYDSKLNTLGSCFNQKYFLVGVLKDVHK